MRSWQAKGPVAIVLLAATACTPTVQASRSPQAQARLPFLVDGQTTKEEILLRFGVPSAPFEGERILTYILRGLDHGP